MELNDVFGLIGFTPKEGEDVTPDILRAHINKSFVPVAGIESRNDIIDPIVSKQIGNRLGKMQTSLVKHGKELGLELTHSSFEGKAVEDVLEHVFGEAKTKLTELKAGKVKPNEEYEKKISALKSERDTFQASLTDIQKEFETFKSQVEREKAEAEKNSILESAFGKVKWPAGTKDVSKMGLRTLFEKEYDLETENGTAYVLSRVSGGRVQSPTNAAAMMTAEDAVIALAKREGLWTDSPHEGEKKKAPGTSGQPPAEPNPRARERKAHPAFFGNR